MNAIFSADGRVNLFDAKEATLQVRALGDRFNNRDTIAEEHAIENLLADRPAFWSSSRGYSNATAGIFLGLVNQLASIRGAIVECEHFYRSGADGRWRSVKLLDELLPLNRWAVRELLSAYEAIGSFRTAEGLYARTAKATPTSAEGQAALNRALGDKAVA